MKVLLARIGGAFLMLCPLYAGFDQAAFWYTVALGVVFLVGLRLFHWGLHD